MVINNENPTPDPENVIEMPGLKGILDEHKRKKAAGGPGMKEFKAPSKKKLEVMCERLIHDNDELAENHMKSGLMLCAIRKACEKIYNDMGGKIITPSMEKHKKHISEIITATETWKDWDKPLDDSEQSEGKGPDGDSGGSPASVVS